jgi:hypothetical protein
MGTAPLGTRDVPPPRAGGFLLDIVTGAAATNAIASQCRGG